MVVVIADVDEVHVDRVVGPLPLDLPHRADVGVLPVARDLVVLGRGESRWGPVDDVAAKRDLTLGIHVEVAVRVAVQLELPWVCVGADRNWLRRAVHVPSCATLVLPGHFVGLQPSDSSGRRHHGGVRFVWLHPTSTRVVFQDLLQPHLLAGGAFSLEAVVVVVEELQVPLVVEAFPSTNHLPLWAGHAEHRFLKRSVAVQNAFGVGRSVENRSVLGRGWTSRGEDEGTQAKQAREGGVGCHECRRRLLQKRKGLP